MASNSDFRDFLRVNSINILKSWVKTTFMYVRLLYYSFEWRQKKICWTVKIFKTQHFLPIYETNKNQNNVNLICCSISMYRLNGVTPINLFKLCNDHSFLKEMYLINKLGYVIL
jgi:hypothetical protein